MLYSQEVRNVIKTILYFSGLSPSAPVRMSGAIRFDPAKHTIGLDRNLNAFQDLEQPDPPLPVDDIDMHPGDGLVVPKGVWHCVDILEPCQIVYLTPGPNNEFLPLGAPA